MTGILSRPVAPTAGTSRQNADERPANPALRGPIVLVVSLDEPAAGALQLARQTAHRLHRELHVVTVIDPMPAWAAVSDLYTVGSALASMPEPLPASEVERSLRERLGLDQDVRMQFRYGGFAAEVCRAAAEVDATVILVDAAPHRTLLRAVSGTRALQLLRHAPCPVLTVTPGTQSPARRVLAAIDFSGASIRAAQSALVLTAADAEVELMHVIVTGPPGVPVREPMTDLVGPQLEEALSRLRDELKRHAAPGVTLTTSVARGTPIEVLLSHATNVKADLVTLGSTGANAVERFLLGSVSTGVLHHAPCSVLAAPADSTKPSSRAA
jgi:nucleotide-binding universal stress UspA family protein